MRSSDIPRINYYLCVQGMNKEGGKRSVEKSVQKEEEERKKKVSQARTERIEDRQGRRCRGFRKKRCRQTGMGEGCLMSASR